MNLITQGLGNRHLLITRGLTQLYFLVDPDVPSAFGGGGVGVVQKAIRDGAIQTRPIQVVHDGRTITVQALLINEEDLIKVEAELVSIRQQGIQVTVIRG